MCCSATQLELHHEAATETEQERRTEGASTDGFCRCARTRTTRVRTHSHTGLMNRRKVSSQNGTIPRCALRNAEAEKRAGARRGGGSGRITGSGEKTAEPGPDSIHLTPSIINNPSISPTFTAPARLRSSRLPSRFPPDSRIRPPAGALLPTKGSLSFPTPAPLPSAHGWGWGWSKVTSVVT